MGSLAILVFDIGDAQLSIPLALLRRMPFTFVVFVSVGLEGTNLAPSHP